MQPQYNPDLLKETYIAAGCSEDEITAVFMPLKKLAQIENGYIVAISARDKKDAFVRDILDPKFIIDNPDATVTLMSKLIKKDSANG